MHTFEFSYCYPWKIFIAKSGWDTSNPGSIIGNNKLIIGYSQKIQHTAKLNLRGQNLKKKYWIKSKEIHFSYFENVSGLFQISVFNQRSSEGLISQKLLKRGKKSTFVFLYFCILYFCTFVFSYFCIFVFLPSGIKLIIGCYVF